MLAAAGLLLSAGATAAELRVSVSDTAGPQAVIEQRARQFQPRVTAVQTGTPVQFPNRDTVRHHAYSFSPMVTLELAS